MALLKRSANGRNTLVLFVAGLLVVLLLFRGRKIISGSPRQTIAKVLQDNGYSPNVANWWGAVSAHETGNFSSPLFLHSNNAFGMMQPKSRKTLSIGVTKASEGDFATFNSLEDSVKDLILYMQEFNYPKDFPSVDALISFMKKKGYFTAPEQQYLMSVKARV